MRKILSIAIILLLSLLSTVATSKIELSQKSVNIDNFLQSLVDDGIEVPTDMNILCMSIGCIDINTVGLIKSKGFPLSTSTSYRALKISNAKNDIYSAEVASHARNYLVNFIFYNLLFLSIYYLVFKRRFSKLLTIVIGVIMVGLATSLITLKLNSNEIHNPGLCEYLYYDGECTASVTLTGIESGFPISYRTVYDRELYNIDHDVSFISNKKFILNLLVWTAFVTAIYLLAIKSKSLYKKH